MVGYCACQNGFALSKKQPGVFFLTNCTTWDNIVLQKLTLARMTTIICKFRRLRKRVQLLHEPTRMTFYLLKPTGYVMHQQFNIQQLCVLPTLYLCVLYFLRTNSDLCHLQHKLIGFYNRDEKCLLRSTNWFFKWSSLRFVFKGLNWRFCMAVT